MYVSIINEIRDPQEKFTFKVKKLKTITIN